jgi:hypothetical protein
MRRASSSPSRRLPPIQAAAGRMGATALLSFIEKSLNKFATRDA